MAFTHGDIAKVDLHWQVGTIGFAANVFQCKLLQDSPHSLSDVDAATDMAAWMTGIVGPMEPHVVVDVDITSASFYKKSGDDWNLITDLPIVFVPESIGDPLPSGVAALITAYTYQSKTQGKKYFPGMSELAQTAGLWVAGVLAALANSGLAWISGFDSIADPTSHWYPGVWSLKSLDFQSFSPVTIVRDVPAYQRRRKQGVGT